MSFAQESEIPRENLTFLQEESLGMIAILAGIVGYVWLWLDIWPVTGNNAPISSWLGAACLACGPILSHYLRTRYLYFASHLLIWCIFVAITCIVVMTHTLETVYLFILPIIFASVLLNQYTMVFISCASGLIILVLTVGQTLIGHTGSAEGTAYPLFVIASVASASWLAARNLHTTLSWFSSAYQVAHNNEQIAREQGAELRRVLKSLDDLTFRLERSNYTLVLERNQAEEARRIKQQFAQTISHELRTPLNLIVAFTDLIVQSPEFYGAPLPPAYIRDLSIVHRNARHLQTLVNDVLDLARIEAAQMSIIPEATNPVSLVEEAINTAHSLVEMRGLTLHTEILPNLPMLWIDPTRIRQVLFNLLNNAVRFTDSGGITIHVHEQDEQIIFSVTDTGVGIAEADIPRLFQDFQQLDATTRRRHGGAGLGLAISRRFVELHGGRIWVESKVGQGSTFFFSLPVMQHKTPSDAHPTTWPDLNNAEVVQIANEKIVLVVTRNFTVAALMMRYVQDCRTVIVQSLSQARFSAQRLLPQSIFVDLSTLDQSDTPENGELSSLVASWGLTGVPIIACEFSDDTLLKDLDVEGYLVKPVSPQNLWDVLRNFEETLDRVLVIDDDHDFVRLLNRILDNPIRHYQVINAHSGQEGVALARRYQPDIIMLDLQLPDMDGTQVIRQLRSHTALQKIPIVIISGQDKFDSTNTIQGPICIGRSGGILASDVVQLLKWTLEH